jgi:uncharacterized coiled-coil DUF342 family protein
MEHETLSVADLWARDTVLAYEIGEMQAERDELFERIVEASKERANIIRQIENIQGEIDWG